MKVELEVKFVNDLLLHSLGFGAPLLFEALLFLSVLDRYFYCLLFHRFVDNQIDPVVEGSYEKHKYAIFLALVKFLQLLVQLFDLLLRTLHKTESEVNGPHEDFDSF